LWVSHLRPIPSAEHVGVGSGTLRTRDFAIVIGAIDHTASGFSALTRLEGLNFARFDGRPIVLVFLQTWAPCPSLLDGIRAELRVLGAAVLVFADDSACCFDPDETLEHLRGDRLRESLRLIRRAWGVEQILCGRDRAAVFVIDDRRTVRFARYWVGSAVPAETMLAAALAEAGRAARSEPNLATSMTRRELLDVALVTALTSVLQACTRARRNGPAPGPSSENAPAGAATAREMDITLVVNGVAHPLRVEPRLSLLDALRERLSLTGTKKGCDHGQCGACTVLMDGIRVNSCLVLAVMAQGKTISTVEGLAQDGEQHALQTAFIAEDAFQCGYCTPGQLMSALGLLKERRQVTPEIIREQMSGNICRCGAYANIVRAIQRARTEV
jgi:xanthine dehydrogenase YagT iron-sulfur-binding subunit